MLDYSFVFLYCVVSEWLNSKWNWFECHSLWGLPFQDTKIQLNSTEEFYWRMKRDSRSWGETCCRFHSGHHRFVGRDFIVMKWLSRVSVSESDTVMCKVVTKTGWVKSFLWIWPLRIDNALQALLLTQLLTLLCGMIWIDWDSRPAFHERASKVGSSAVPAHLFHDFPRHGQNMRSWSWIGQFLKIHDEFDVWEFGTAWNLSWKIPRINTFLGFHIAGGIFV